MNVLLIFCFIFGGFTQKWYIPQGTERSAGRILIGDTDRNGDYEFMFTTYGGPYAIYFYELHLPNTWEVDTIFYPYTPLLWDSDDFDGDGFYDLVMQCGSIDPFWVGITIFESPDSFSYPTQEVWRDTVDIGTVQPICAYDIDKDGISEIIQTGGEPGTNYYIDFSIYESISDNLYQVKYFFESPETPTSTIVFGDIDRDGLNEFVMGTIDGQYSIFESPENDSFLPLFVNVQLPTKNIKDCFAAPDADGDGKMEFVVKGFTFPDGKFQVFIFEATGDNSYEIVDTFNFSGFSNGYYRGHSAVGDVDGDGLPEIALEGSFRVYMIEADGNDNFYVFDTLPGNSRGSSIAMYDIDGNGLDEVVISGNNETRIYEYVPQGVEEKQTFTKDHPEISISPNPFRDRLNINFSIEHSAEITELKIYDATGRLVKEFSHTSNQQFKQVIWAGDDNYGNKVSSGVYFLMFTTERVRETRNLLLIR